MDDKNMEEESSEKSTEFPEKSMQYASAEATDDVPSTPKMATVQIGSLGNHSVHDLAEHLPNIGIHFSCKVCNVTCTQMNELLQHLMNGKCQGQSTILDASSQPGTSSILSGPIATVAKSSKSSSSTPAQQAESAEHTSPVIIQRTLRKDGHLDKNQSDLEIEDVTPITPQKRGRGRPRKIVIPEKIPFHGPESDKSSTLEGHSPAGGVTMAAGVAPAKRGRGRPRKVPVDPDLPMAKPQLEQPQPTPTSRKDDYEELPMISAPVTEEAQGRGRQTRYSSGKIKRIDVAALLGRKIKDEPEDDDDSYIPPGFSAATIKSSKRNAEDDDGHESPVKRPKQLSSTGESLPRRRGRPPKLKQEISDEGDSLEVKSSKNLESDTDEGKLQAEESHRDHPDVTKGETSREDLEKDVEPKRKEQTSVDRDLVLSPVKKQVQFTGLEGDTSQRRASTTVRVRHGPTKVIVIEPGRKPETDGEVLSLVADALAGKLISSSGSPVLVQEGSSNCESPEPYDLEEELDEDCVDDGSADYYCDEVDEIEAVRDIGDDNEKAAGVEPAGKSDHEDEDVNKDESDANTTKKILKEENDVAASKKDTTGGKSSLKLPVARIVSLKNLQRAKQIKQATRRAIYPVFPRKPLIVNQRKRFHKCALCKQRFFASQDEVKIHTECHLNKPGEKEAYKCVECDYKSPLWNRMLDHIVTHSSLREKFRNSNFVKNIIGEFVCPVCNKKFERKNNMKGHLSKVHYKQNRVCESCGETLFSVDDKTFKRHVEKCQNLLFQCSHCTYKTPVSANMRKHMKIHLGQGFECEICQAMFPSRQRYAVHRNTHNENRRKVMCEFCGQEFMSDDAIKKHVVRVHTEGTLMHHCTECSFKTKIQTDLKKHITMVHNKKFKCTECPYQTNSEAAFEQHGEYHGPGRQFACTYEKCYYRGATHKQLSNHISQVHKLTCKHMCPICQRFYKKKTHLARHLVSHTGEKPYICLECGLQFSSHSTYYRHRNKTGHDAQREGVVSVPQNITIQYVSPDTEVQFEELQEGTEQVIHQTEGHVLEEMTEQEVENMGEQGGVPAKKQNIIMLDTCEVEDGQPVTYLLRMGEDEHGQPTMVTADGMTMDPTVMQQIQEQLAQMEEKQIVVEGSGLQEVVQEDQIQHEAQIITGEQEVQESHILQEGQILPEGYIVQGGQLVQGIIVEEEEVIQDDTEAITENTMSQSQELAAGYMMQQAQVITETEASDGQSHAVMEMTQMDPDGVGMVMQGVQGEGQEEQVVYEESVVEVTDPHGTDGSTQQYAILLLPSTAASGDEPEAALSMLQLQSGNSIATTSDVADFTIQ